jgi:hypothetical protein
MRAHGRPRGCRALCPCHWLHGQWRDLVMRRERTLVDTHTHACTSTHTTPTDALAGACQRCTCVCNQCHRATRRCSPFAGSCWPIHAEGLCHGECPFVPTADLHRTLPFGRRVPALGRWPVSFLSPSFSLPLSFSLSLSLFLSLSLCICVSICLYLTQSRAPEHAARRTASLSGPLTPQVVIGGAALAARVPVVGIPSLVSPAMLIPWLVLGVLLPGARVWVIWVLIAVSPAAPLLTQHQPLSLSPTSCPPRPSGPQPLLASLVPRCLLRLSCVRLRPAICEELCTLCPCFWPSFS